MTQEETVGERRVSKRYKAKLRVLFQRSGSTHFIDAETDNISVTGAYVKTRRRPLEKGTTVSLLLNLTGLDKELMLNGVVAWVIEQPTGMGIRFTDMSKETQEILSERLKELGHQERDPNRP